MRRELNDFLKLPEYLPKNTTSSGSDLSDLAKLLKSKYSNLTAPSDEIYRGLIYRVLNSDLQNRDEKVAMIKTLQAILGFDNSTDVDPDLTASLLKVGEIICFLYFFSHT